MHATITIKVCSWSSLATEFPCNHEDPNQSWNPKAASALVFEAAQAHLGECSSLVLLCPGLVPLQMHVYQHSFQLSGPRPTPMNLAPARTCLRVLLMCPTACTSVILFLPHQMFIFFWPSHLLLLSNLLKFFISLSPLCSSPYPDPAYTCFVVLQRKTT